MNRYIDADLMREKAYQMNFDRRINERELFLFNRALSEMPTVDAVPVVRCGEYRWACLAPQRQTATCMKNRLPFTHDYEYFCADGERRTDEQ